jgi:NitT/TauT family transport system permease protein
VLLKSVKANLVFSLPLFGLLAIWELTSLVGEGRGNALPAPHTIVERAVDLLGSSSGHVLIAHSLASLLRALAAFLLAAIVAVPVGFLLGRSKSAYAWAAPVMSMLLPLPAVAWTPIFLVTLGRGEATIISVCFLGAFFPIAYSTIQGVQAIPKQSIWVLRSMGGSQIDVLVRILIPSSLPTVLTGFRLGLAHSWRTLVAAEMLAAAAYGLGYMIFAARAYADSASMFVGIAVLAVLGLLMENVLFGFLERLTVSRWYPNRGKRSQ